MGSLHPPELLTEGNAGTIH
jgi:hypothetical protein